MAYFTLGSLPVHMVTNARTDRYGNPIPYAVAGGIMMPVGPTMHIAPGYMSVYVTHSRAPVTPTIPIHTYHSYKSSVNIPPPPPPRSRMDAISGRSVPTISWLNKMVCALDTLKGNVPYIMERTTDSALRVSWHEDAMKIVWDVTKYMMSPHLQDEHTSEQHYNTMHLLVMQGNDILLTNRFSVAG
jgi:hypothetical protein